MSYRTDRKNLPREKPYLFRQAQFSDITNPNVLGFYDPTGGYWRKNGAPKTWKRNKSRASVPVKFGIRNYDVIDEHNFWEVYVRLDEIKGDTK